MLVEIPRRPFKPRVLVSLGWNDPRIFRAIGRYACTAGWHLETRQFFDQVAPENWSGEGLIVSHPERADLLSFMRRQAALQPTVLLGSCQLGIPLTQVCEDNLVAGRMAAEHFLERGYRHYAWLTAHSGDAADERYRGFSTALREAGYKCRRLVYRPPPGVRHDWMDIQRWLAAKLRELPRPLACYALDDQQAADAIEVCVAQGWRVPEDIAIMGTGNIEIACECSHVPISSVDLADEEIALAAAALLDKLMKGHKPPKRAIVIPPRGVVVRASTDFLAVVDPQLRRAVGFIAENLRRSFSVEQVAAAAGVSRRTLYNLFQRDFSRSPAQFIAHARLDRARKLLAAAPKMPITQIAEQTGFGSTRTMTRTVLRHEGMNARGWRKKFLRQRPQSETNDASPDRIKKINTF